jgi:hypothetical protein
LDVTSTTAFADVVAGFWARVVVGGVTVVVVVPAKAGTGLMMRVKTAKNAATTVVLVYDVMTKNSTEFWQ